MNNSINENINNNFISSQTVSPVQSQSNTTINQTYNNPGKGKSRRKKIILAIVVLLILVGVIAFFLIKGLFKNDEISNLNYIFDPDKPIIIEKEGKYGYITSEGKTMIEPQFNDANDFYGDYAVVSVDNPDEYAYNDNLYQIIDKKGNVKLEVNSYIEPEYYSDYNIWVANGILYDSKLNPMLEEGITVNYISDGYLAYVNNIKNEAGIMTYKEKVLFTLPSNSINVDICSAEYDTDDLYASVRTYN